MKKRTKNKSRGYTSRGFFYKLFAFWIYKAYDIYKSIKNGPEFDEFGVTMYCGRQGAGKTIGMVEYLERMRAKYPKALIITNFGYIHETQAMKDWQDFFKIKNNEDGIIFAIDEIQNEFSAAAWSKFPESLLSEITQQRKQRVKIVCTSQIYTRVAKQLREQCNDVVDCVTFAKRWTFLRCYDAVDYNKTIDSPTAKQKIRLLYRKSFLQDNYIRNLYDTRAKIERLERTEFLEKDKRAS